MNTKRIILAVVYAVAMIFGFLVIGAVGAVVQGIFGHTIAAFIAIALVVGLCWHWAGKDLKKDDEAKYGAPRYSKDD